jgi:hypothetical protein
MLGDRIISEHAVLTRTDLVSEVCQMFFKLILNLDDVWHWEHDWSGHICVNGHRCSVRWTFSVLKFCDFWHNGYDDSPDVR